MTDRTLLSTTEFAEKYGFATETVRRWCRTGRVNAIKIGHNYRIKDDQLTHPKKGQDPWD